MIQNLWLDFTSWLSQLERLFMHAWHTLTPMQYGGLLVCVAVFGWLLMKSDMKPS